MAILDNDECRFYGEQDETPVQLITECFGVCQPKESVLGVKI